MLFLKKYVILFIGDIMKKDSVLIFGLVGESLFMKTDHFHRDGETIVIDDVYKEPGGKGYNQAITINKMEEECGFVGVVGNDEFGRLSIEHLNKLKINNHIIVKDNLKSSFATILIDKKGNNQVSVYPKASNSITIDDLNNLENLFDEYEYILIQLELEEHITKQIIELSIKHHNKLIINPAPFKDWALPYLKYAQIITPNFQEAKAIYQIETDNYNELINKIQNNFITTTIVTIGKDGAILITKENSVIIPSVVEQEIPVDTTGAGDIFTGTFVSMFIKKYPLEKAIVYANYAASLSVQKQYVLPSIPSFKDIKMLKYIHDDEFDQKTLNNTRKTVRTFARREDGKWGLIRIIGNDDFGIRNHLETSGGGIERGETEIEALTREIKEELGFRVVKSDFIGNVVYEFNLINRITLGSYYIVLVDTSTQNTNYTDDERKLFKGIEWYTLNELEMHLKNEQLNKCDRLVHKRELVALDLLKAYLKEQK